ncbi:MAG TPA: HAD-IIB family hydrolase [Burkholderiales bacterium]|nr:HAD-IIB family hydrolase [Burkholderiales bacterium]
MRYHVLACDYDGTLASDGRVFPETVEALKRVRDSGRKLVLVTGRELDQLLEVFPEIELFERVVAENGALLYCPVTRKEKILGNAPPREFAAALEARGLPISQGRVIVATWEPHEVATFEVIRDLGLELQVIFNKGAVMVLPSGVNKASGLAAALAELRLSAHNTVGIGDAENDHAFLSLCECSVAVANALAITKKHADHVTQKDHGRGVVELAQALIDDDLAQICVSRHQIALGKRDDGEEVRIPPYGLNVMITGTSGAGKSTLATSLLERLAEEKYQYCIVDPEGDYASLELNDLVVLGDNHRAPNPDEVLDLLSEPEQNAVVNMIGVSIEHRPDFFVKLIPRIQELRDQTGHPHWVLIDEAHHLLPAARGEDIARQMRGMIAVTVHPEHVSPEVLSAMDVVLTIGEEPENTFRTFSGAIGGRAPEFESRRLSHGEAFVWDRRGAMAPYWIRTTPPQVERKRHHRKYMEGELAPENSFYFTGPEKKLNLRAQNLTVFMQLADGLDDETWDYHFKQGDYAKWFRETLKDDDLASEIEGARELTPRDARALVKNRIKERYTAPE